jgi:hypothetical protein
LKKGEKAIGKIRKPSEDDGEMLNCKEEAACELNSEQCSKGKTLRATTFFGLKNWWTLGHITGLK